MLLLLPVAAAATAAAVAVAAVAYLLAPTALLEDIQEGKRRREQRIRIACAAEAQSRQVSL
jgi:heme exporter protein D